MKPSRQTPRQSHRPLLPLAILFVEGKTEFNYFNKLKQLVEVRRSWQVRVEQQPRSKLVETARRKTSELSRKDIICCVMDTEARQADQLPELRKSLHQADSAKIPIILSNPCFEVWLIARHGKHSAWQKCKDVERVLDDVLGHEYRKGELTHQDTSMDGVNEALSNAKTPGRPLHCEGYSIPEAGRTEACILVSVLVGKTDRAALNDLIPRQQSKPG
ncbi:MAG: RloB domain-containing protein [Phycisphaeraceae bacterium]|nr:RloB domain-containing protein [Phycisphaeraceae bacterium]